LLRSAARTAGRTALIAGTATAVSGRVAQRQHAAATHGSNAARHHARDDRQDDVVGRLQSLADLRASGALNDKEFAAAKAKLLK
jgi:hypothetical protein